MYLIGIFHKVIVLLEYIDVFVQYTNLTGEETQPYCNNYMLALCLMHLGTYHVKNYAGIISMDQAMITMYKFSWYL